MRFTIGFAKQVWAGLLVLLALTVVLGVVYPAAVWGVSRMSSGICRRLTGHRCRRLRGRQCLGGCRSAGRRRAAGPVLPQSCCRIRFGRGCRLPPVIPLRHCRPTRGRAARFWPDSSSSAGQPSRHVKVSTLHRFPSTQSPVRARYRSPHQSGVRRTAGREGGGGTTASRKTRCGTWWPSTPTVGNSDFSEPSEVLLELNLGTRIDGTYVCCTDDWWMIVT